MGVTFRLCLIRFTTTSNQINSREHLDKIVFSFYLCSGTVSKIVVYCFHLFVHCSSKMSQSSCRENQDSNMFATPSRIEQKNVGKHEAMKKQRKKGRKRRIFNNLTRRVMTPCPKKNIFLHEALKEIVVSRFC